MAKRSSSRRKTMVFSPSTGVVRGYETMPVAAQRAAAAHKRRKLSKRNDAALDAVMKDLNDVKRMITASKDPFYADVHRRIDRIKRRLSGKKAVMFAM